MLSIYIKASPRKVISTHNALLPIAAVYQACPINACFPSPGLSFFVSIVERRLSISILQKFGCLTF